MYPASNNLGLNKETETAVYFFTNAFYPLDNFSAHVIEIWGRKFPTVEHAYQWKKFSLTHPDIAKEILSATSPEAVKKVSDRHIDKIPVEWYEGASVAVMEELLKAKADQHEDVRDTLKKTGTRDIIENSPVDNFWGAGPDGKGKNMVGKLWMKIRTTLP